jgi:hypothetical protein
VTLEAAGTGRVDPTVAAEVEVGPGWGLQAASTPDATITQTKHQPSSRQAKIKPLPNFIDSPHYTRPQ